jgi:hypothetical protein
MEKETREKLDVAKDGRKKALALSALRKESRLYQNG